MTDSIAIYNWASESTQHMLILCLIILIVVTCIAVSIKLGKKEQDLTNLAVNELKKDLKNGKEIFGWKYYDTHKNILGPCVYDGELFIPLNRKSSEYGATELIHRYKQIHAYYINKVQEERLEKEKKLKDANF